MISLCDKAREACPELPDHPGGRTGASPTRHGATMAFRRTAADIDTRIRHLVPVLEGRFEPLTTSDQYASVRYLVDDVEEAVDFYTTQLGFTLNMSAAPAFADVVRGPLRLLLSGPASSGARATPDDAAMAGRNRIHLIVDDLDAGSPRLRGTGLSFRSDVVAGPGGRQILLTDPAGNLIELFQPAPS